MPEFSVAHLADVVGGEVIGDGSRVVAGVAALESAGPRELSLVANRRYTAYVPATSAAAVLIAPELADQISGTLTQIRVADPHAALREVLLLLYPPVRLEPGVHPTAIVEDAVQMGAGVRIDAYSVIGRGAVLADGVSIGAHTVVGEACEIGAGTVLHPHVTLYPQVRIGAECVIHSGARLGNEGFGYAFVGGEHRKVPQVGGCRIEDEVEIGANTTIDRGSIGDTVVGRGTKIDSLVHLGHNVRIGERAIIIAQVGVAGSSTVGDGAVLAGQVGVSGHLTIGAGARVAAQAGVIGDVPAGETVSGYPARPHREALRAQAAMFRLPSLLKRMLELERVLLRRTEDAPDPAK